MFDKTKSYGILGIARSGIAAAEKIVELGGKCFLSDIQPEASFSIADQIKARFECEFGGHSDRLLKLDEWIISPGIPLTIPIIEKGKARGIKMISEIEFAFQIKHPESKIIAVTGSNGKSTTASLIFHILQRMGYKAILAGNIGDAFSGYPIHKPGFEYIVLEISSFQLDLIETFRPDVSVLLNITPDHLNRYETFEHYARSKHQIFRNQTPKDFAVLNQDDYFSMRSANVIKAEKLLFSSRDTSANAWMDGIFICFSGGEKLSIYELELRGPHNYQNAMAAILATNAIIKDRKKVIGCITGFQPLCHRLEFVATVNGVSFYNDSKATNTDSVRYALQSFERPIRIIMGGSDKGEDFAILTDILSTNAIKVYINGDTTDKMRQAWLGKVPLVCFKSLEECIYAAFEESLSGDSIVLSPACASYDQFSNFEHRGDTFKSIVQKIAQSHETE